jgi:hypothetical protein
MIQGPGSQLQEPQSRRQPLRLCQIQIQINRSRQLTFSSDHQDSWYSKLEKLPTASGVCDSSQVKSGPRLVLLAGRRPNDVNAYESEHDPICQRKGKRCSQESKRGMMDEIYVKANVEGRYEEEDPCRCTHDACIEGKPNGMNGSITTNLDIGGTSLQSRNRYRAGSQWSGRVRMLGRLD